VLTAEKELAKYAATLRNVGLEQMINSSLSSKSASVSEHESQHSNEVTNYLSPVQISVANNFSVLFRVYLVRTDLLIIDRHLFCRFNSRMKTKMKSIKKYHCCQLIEKTKLVN
jgi:hypothetical protein